MLTDPKKIKDEIVAWIREYFAENGPTASAVVGISGGKDSSVVARDPARHGQHHGRL